MIGPRSIVVHGHFYQPPRENPWLDCVEVQDSAAPYHDWNARVTAECYGPNTAARRTGSDNRIIDIVNSFDAISFNVGPTLFAWLARHRPDVAEKIIEADRASARRRGGHGNAIAQAYSHPIMPLAIRGDKVTQVRWAIADFRARFDRKPEGMWLPETAVDDETLEVLAEEGIKFTILAPHQALRIRAMGDERWRDASEALDTTRPYLWRGRRDLSLAVFFYDAAISHAIAFDDKVLERGERLVARLRAGFPEDENAGARLVHCATDGESYGHHHKFGEMALAAALHQIEAEGREQLTNYGEFLAENPPAWEVEIRQQSSWSCAHGVERWRADCGCRFRTDWHQRWRGPLREALDWLRDEVDGFFEVRGANLFRDPWAARDAYIDVILDHSPARLGAFLAAHQRTPLGEQARVDARRLLEMQRNRILMYTSCGWFFDEISGLEATQILRYAAMALQHMRDLGGGNLEDELVRRLEAAPSNVAEYRNGGDVYRRLIRPAVVTLRRVIAHYAISGLFEAYPDDAAVYAYHVKRLDEARESYGGTALRIAHVRVRSELTGETREDMYAVIHFGGHDFSCGIRSFEDHASYDAMKADLLRRYARYSMADMVRGMDEYFPKDTFSLTQLFLEERRRVLANVIRAVLEKYETTYKRIWEENRKLMRYLRHADAPVPEALGLVARHVLEQEVISEVERLPTFGLIPERVFELCGEAQALGLSLDLLPARDTMREAVRRALADVDESPTGDRIAHAVALIEGAQRLGIHFGLWEAQNEFLDLWRRRPGERGLLKPLADRLGFNLAA